VRIQPQPATVVQIRAVLLTQGPDPFDFRPKCKFQPFPRLGRNSVSSAAPDPTQSAYPTRSWTHPNYVDYGIVHNAQRATLAQRDQVWLKPNGLCHEKSTIFATGYYRPQCTSEDVIKRKSCSSAKMFRFALNVHVLALLLRTRFKYTVGHKN